MSQKMIQHTEWDKKTGKKIITMVPQSKEHKQRSISINRALSKYKEPTEEERKKHNQGRFYSHGKFHYNRAYND